MPKIHPTAIIAPGAQLADDVVIGPPVQIRHHADATGVVFVCRVVEASGHRRPSVWSERRREQNEYGTTLARRVKNKNTRRRS